MRVLAATAYKEFLHSLSDTSKKRLLNAGITKRGDEALSRHVLGMQKKSKVPHIQVLNDDPMYVPTVEQSKYIFKKKIKLPTEMDGKILYGPKSSPLTMYHENLEATLAKNPKYVLKGYAEDYAPITYKGMADFLTGKQKTLHDYIHFTSHVSPAVTVNELRVQNQSGVVDKVEQGIRNSTGEYPIIKKLLGDKNRIRSSDYKRAIRKLSNIYNKKDLDAILKLIG